MNDMLSTRLSDTSEKHSIIKAIHNIPEYLHMTRHVYRSEKYTVDIVKTLHDTRHIVAVEHHYSLFCLEGPCYIGYNVNSSIAHLHHYRNNCQFQIKKKICEEEYKKNVVRDTTIWKYKTDLIKNSITALKNLGFVE